MLFSHKVQPLTFSIWAIVFLLGEIGEVGSQSLLLPRKGENHIVNHRLSTVTVYSSQASS